MPSSTLDAPDDFDDEFLPFRPQDPDASDEGNDASEDDPDGGFQRLLNDAKREELEDRFGARFFHRKGMRVPPEVERIWLRHIEDFERLKETAETVPLRRFVGLDYVPPLADLPEGAVAGELKALLERLGTHAVHVEFPEGADPREAYGLLVDGLLDEPVLDLRQPGLHRHFVLRRRE